MCSGRIDLEFILRALANRQDGVFIGGCRLGECNYTTQGNFDALAVTMISKKIMEYIGINPDRLRIEFMNASDGILLAESINSFSRTIRELGQVGKAEGIDPAVYNFKLAAIRKMVPYIRLVERERLRIPVKSKEKYYEFYSSEEFDRLFKELIVDKLAMSQITALLGKEPLTTGEISDRLGLNPSEVAKYMNTSSRHGLVRYDVDQNRYALA